MHSYNSALALIQEVYKIVLIRYGFKFQGVEGRHSKPFLLCLSSCLHILRMPLAQVMRVKSLSNAQEQVAEVALIREYA